MLNPLFCFPCGGDLRKLHGDGDKDSVSESKLNTKQSNGNLY